jgi:hypothetical protein
MLRYVAYIAALVLGAWAGMRVEVPPALDAGGSDARSSDARASRARPVQYAMPTLR